MPDFRRSERISISRAVPGMELAKDIYSRSNQVILNAGSILDATKISKIMFYSIFPCKHRCSAAGFESITEEFCK